jgi:hypothetical protein
MILNIFSLKILSADIIQTDADLLFKIVKNIDQTSSTIKIDVNKFKADQLFNSRSDILIINNFKMDNYTAYNLELKKDIEPFDETTQFEFISDKGIESYPPPEIKFFSGKIDNDPDSKVYISYYDGMMTCIIKTGSNDAYSIRPVFNPSDRSISHYLSSSNKVTDSLNKYNCLTLEVELESTEFQDIVKQSNNIQLAPSKLMEVKLACEATSEFYKLFNDKDKATAYISSVIKHTSKLYEEFLNTRLIISYFLIWTNSTLDPYINENLISDKLFIMPDLWKNKNVDRSIAVLFASLAAQQGNVSVAGIAFGGQPGRGNLCSKDNGYCVLGIRGGENYPTNDYTWDVNVAAHEIGHLFGAPHTHSCYYQPNMIDTCVTESSTGVSDACIKNGNVVPRNGTIMSYCHLTNKSHSVDLIFHPREYPSMRKAVERATCAKEVVTAYVSLLSPLGGLTYRSSDNLPIRWTSSMVSKVSLKYSTNAGKDWIPIADNLNTNDSVFIWKPNNVQSTEVVILVHSSSDLTINDRSFVNFSVLAPLITIINPKDGDRFPQNSSLKLYWNKVFVDSVKIEFSSDNGNSWSNIGFAGKNTDYSWILPIIESNENLFKISSVDGTNIQTLSGKFSIGQPKASLTSPIDFEKLCIGDIFRIKWSSDFINICYLEYSIDAGQNWKKITPIPLDPTKGYYDWKVPDRATIEGRVRISTKTNDLIYLDQSKNNFWIYDCKTSVDELSKSHKLTIDIINNSQSDDLVNLKILNHYGVTGVSDIFLTDILGNRSKIGSINLESEIYNFTFNMSDKPHGTYFLEMNNNSGCLSNILKIIR